MIDVLGDRDGITAEFGESQTLNLRTADLVINGALVETKLCLYGKVGCNSYFSGESKIKLYVLSMC